MRHKNKIGGCLVDSITMLPMRWNSAIEKQGDYIEGLWTDNLKERKVLVNKIVCITFEMASLY